MIGDIAVAGGWSVSLGVAYVSTYIGYIGYVATCVELWLHMLEVLLPMLEVVG